jgi:hypothetical protein
MNDNKTKKSTLEGQKENVKGMLLNGINISIPKAPKSIVLL